MEFFNKLYENPVDSNHVPLLYANILGHPIQVDPEFIELIFFTVSRLHEEEDLLSIFSWLLEHDACLLDVILMCWCIPNGCFSEAGLERLHKQLVLEQLPKLIALRDTEPIKQFCIETVTKTCQLPVHCFDLIWPYLTLQQYTIAWKPAGMSKMIYLSYDDDNCLEIHLDASVIHKLGLGMIPDRNGLTFMSLHKSIVENAKELISKTPTGNNFLEQLQAML